MVFRYGLVFLEKQETESSLFIGNMNSGLLSPVPVFCLMERCVAHPFKIVAHGGAAGYAPENTLVSFEKGIELGANTIEVDVHLSKDGELVVIHDATLNKTTNGSGYVYDYTVKELKEFDAGVLFDEKFRGEKIPTFQEVVELARGRARIDIDVKNGPVIYPGIEEKVVRAIEKNTLVNEVTVISFNHLSLKQIKTLNPEIQTGAVYSAGLLEPWAAAELIGADVLYPKHFHPMKDVVLEAHRRGYPVNPWTIDTEKDVRRWLSYGVDGMTSNYPDLVRNIVMESLK